MNNKDRELTGSDKYLKKSNRLILVVGLVALLAFGIGVMSLGSKEEEIYQAPEIDLTISEDPFGDRVKKEEVDIFADASVTSDVLVVSPENIDLGQVVIGSRVESKVVIGAAPKKRVRITSVDFEDLLSKGFDVKNSCPEGAVLFDDTYCNIAISWKSDDIAKIQNNITIIWMEETSPVPVTQKTVVQIIATAVPLDCVVCDEVSPGGSVVPEILALGLNNEILGKINTKGELLINEAVVGKMLGDGTLVDNMLKVIGRAVNKGSVIDSLGNVVGKIMEDGTAVDAGANPIGSVRFDGSVVNTQGTEIAYAMPRGMVLGDDGWPLGEINERGEVLNVSSDIIGKIKPDGLVTDIAGRTIGWSVPKGVAVANNCRFIGYVQKDGAVVDESSRSLGRVHNSGFVIDKANKVIGAVIKQGIVTNNKGATIGYVNREGKVVNSTGDIVACMDPSGKAVSIEDGRIIGGMVSHTGVVGKKCARVGFVFPDASVRSSNGSTVGKMLPTGEAIDLSGNPIGVSVLMRKYGMDMDIGKIPNLFGPLFSSALVMGDNCKPVGRIDSQGRVYNENGLEVACLSDDYSLTDSSGVPVRGVVVNGGPAFDTAGKYIGIIGLDGQVLTKEGTFIGCINPDKNIVDTTGKNIGFSGEKSSPASPSSGNVILGADGQPIGYMRPDGQVVDVDGNIIGRMMPDGSVIGIDGVLLGKAAEKGVVVSSTGEILGRINENGEVVNKNGEVIGRVLPDGSVIGKDGEILGKFYKQNAIIISVEGEVIAKVDANGNAVNPAGEVIGKLRQDSLVVDGNNSVIGGVMPKGTVIDIYGNAIGTVREDASVVNDSDEVIGQVLLNGVVIDRLMDVIGEVADGSALFMTNEGIIGGSILSNGKVIDRSQEVIGGRNAKGTVISNNGIIIGSSVPSGIVADKAGNILGHVNNKGIVVNASNNIIGRMLSRSVAVDTQGRVMGSLVPAGYVAIDNSGNWLGLVSPDGSVVNNYGELVARATPDLTLRDNKTGDVVGKALPNGLIIGNNGNVYGNLMPDGSILTKAGTAEGRVLPDGTALNSENEIVGALVPYGRPIVDNTGKVLGLAGYKNAMSPLAGGTASGVVLNNGVVVDPANAVVGYVSDNSFTALNEVGEIIGYRMEDMSVVSSNGKPVGYVVGRSRVADKMGKILGGLAPSGIVIANDASFMGRTAFDGTVFNAVGSAPTYALPSGKVTDRSRVIGAVVEERLAITPVGMILGKINPKGEVRDFNDTMVGKAIFDGMVTDGNGNYIGGIMPLGTAVTENGRLFGHVGRDGYVTDHTGSALGRVLPDKTVVSINSKTNYSTVPIVAYMVREGAVVGPNNKPMGYAFPDGQVIDVLGQVKGKTNSFSILDPTGKPAGPVVDADVAMSQGCRALGGIDAQATVFDFRNGALLGAVHNSLMVYSSDNAHLGGVKTSGTVFNRSCQQIGYVAPDGSVVDLKGRSIGCVGPDGSIIQVNGGILGKTVPRGIIRSAEGKVHRILYNGSAIDDAGITLGCLQSDNTVTNPSGDAVDELARTTYASSTGDALQQVVEPVVMGMPGIKRNLGPGGGFGSGEAYDPVARQALQMAQQTRRESMSMGEIRPSRKVRQKALAVNDWSVLNIEKNVMSNPVKMNRVITKGKAIPAVLARSVDSRFDVPMEAYVDRNIYADDGREILIPAGSKLVGQTVQETGASKLVPKLSIQWERLIRPDGASFVFENAASTGDSQGRGGVPGYVDMQLLRKYGLPLLQTILTSAVTYGMAAWDDNSATAVARDTGDVIMTAKQQAAKDARDSFRDKMDAMFQAILADTVPIPPVVFIPSGTRITVFATNDLWVLPSHWEDMEEDDDKKPDDIPFADKKSRKTSSGDGNDGETERGTATTVYEPAGGGSSSGGYRGTGGAYPSGNYAPPVYIPPASSSSTPVAAPAAASSSSENTSTAPRLF